MPNPWETDILPGIYADARQILVQIAAAAGDPVKLAQLAIDLASTNSAITDKTTADNSDDYVIVRNKNTRVIYELPLSAIGGNSAGSTGIQLGNLTVTASPLTQSRMIYRAANNSIYVLTAAAALGTQRLNKVSLTSGILTTFTPPTYPSARGELTYNSSLDRIYVSTGNGIEVFDCVTEAWQAALTPATWGQGSLWYDSSSNLIAYACGSTAVGVITLAGASVITSIAPVTPVALIVVGGLIYAIENSGTRIKILTMANPAVLQNTFTMPFTMNQCLAHCPIDGYLYIPDNAGNMKIVDPSTGSVLYTISTGSANALVYVWYQSSNGKMYAHNGTKVFVVSPVTHAIFNFWSIGFNAGSGSILGGNSQILVAQGGGVSQTIIGNYQQ